MSRWVDVGAIDELKFDPGAPVRIGSTWLAVFRLGAGFTAIDNLCPHAGAPLCDGTRMDDKIICYLHCWEFDLRTGACDVGGEWNVRTYTTREREGRLEVEWPG